MRRQKSFLITVIPTEEPQNDFCGQVKSVSTGKACTFSSLDEFRVWLMNEMAPGSPEPALEGLASSRLAVAAIKP